MKRADLEVFAVNLVHAMSDKRPPRYDKATELHRPSTCLADNVSRVTLGKWLEFVRE